MKSVSIIIPTWNGVKLLATYFDSVVAAAERYRDESGAELEVLVVDDASTDDTCKWLAANYCDREFVRVIQLDKNVGFLRAVNKGFESAQFPIVFLLNNDVSVEPCCIAPLVLHFDDEDVFAVSCRADRIGTGRLDGGGKIGLFEKGFWRTFINYEVLQNIDSTHLPELISFFGCGGYSAFDRDKFREVGGFQDCLAPSYWEDIEIGYRAWKRGWSVRYEPSSRVHHQGSATMGVKTMRKEMAIVAERNRLIMIWINLHDRRWMASHIAWLGFKLFRSCVALRWKYLRSFVGAIARIPAIRKARKCERGAAKISDRQLVERFRTLIDQPEIFVLVNQGDELAFTEAKNNRSQTPIAG